MKTNCAQKYYLATLLFLLAALQPTTALTQEPDRVGILTQALRGGDVIKGYRGVVETEIEWVGTDFTGLCTGSMINGNAVLTAAHCLLLPTGNLLESIDVYYHHPERGRYLVYRGAVEAFVHSDFDPAGSPDAGLANADIGVLKIAGIFAGTDRADYLDLFASDEEAFCIKLPIFGYVCQKLMAYGAGQHSYSGAEDDQLRAAKYKIESIKKNHIVVDNTKRKTLCIGDSGGPLIYVIDGESQPIPTITGVLSSFETFVFENDNCANNDLGIDDAFYSRTNWEKIENIMVAAGLRCDLHTEAGVSYRRCANLPVMDTVGRDRAIGKATAERLLESKPGDPPPLLPQE